MELLKLCGGALIAVTLSLMIRKGNEEFARASSLLCSLLLLSAALTALMPVLTYLREQSEGAAFSDYARILFKCLGVSLLVQTCADLCRDSGESALAGRLETVGKAEILLLALPMVKELFAFAERLGA
ncbi:MAG: stage III sporulation protein AD [Ruminococcaceae bacterium]|nr:stage III sporulation protein AD [Oscillospiraceae bacterium]